MGQPCPGPPHGFVGEGERGRAGPRALSRSLSTAAAAWEVCGQHGAPELCCAPKGGLWLSGSVPARFQRAQCVSERSPSPAGREAAAPQLCS